MGWSGGSYTKGNAATGGWTGDASLGIGIEAGRHDTQDNDFATGINQCINKDGSNSFTGNPNLGGFIPTNLAAGTAAAPAVCVGNDVNTGIFGPAADTWAVATNGTEKFRITSTGDIGINVTPDAFSSVALSSGKPNVLITKFSADNGGTNFIFQKSRSATLNANTVVQSGDGIGSLVWQGANGTAYNNAAAISAEVDGTPGLNDMPGRLVFSTTPDGTSSVVERMRINNGGFVSINGTPDSIYRLRIGGRLRIGSSVAGESELAWGSNSTPSNIAWGCSVRGDIGGSNDDLKIFRVDPATQSFQGIAMQIQNTSGCVGMNVTPSNLSTLLINGQGATSATYSLTARNSSSQAAFYVRDDGLINTGLLATSPYNLTTGSAANVFVDANGTLFRSTSSARYKTDIQPYSRGLSDVLALAPKFYKGINDGNTQFAGLIAEDVHDAGLAEFVVYNDKGEPDALAYSNMVALAFKAIQELNTKVETLETRVAELEA